MSQGVGPRPHAQYRRTIVQVAEEQLDVLGRARTSNARGVFGSFFDNALGSEIGVCQLALRWIEDTEGLALITADENAGTVSVRVGNADGTATLQTREYFTLWPAESPMVFLGFQVNSADDEDGVRSRVGIFDDTDGVFFEQNTDTTSAPTGARFVLRSTVSGATVDTVVAQTNWSDDRLDGTGSSRQTLDLSDVQTFVIDFGWGSGRIRLGFLIQGRIIWAHVIDTANEATAVWCRRGSLPIRYQITKNVSDAKDSALAAITQAWIREGAEYRQAVRYEATREAATITLLGPETGVAAPWRAIIALRKKHLAANLWDFRTTAGPAFFAGTAMELMIVLNPQIDSGSFTWVDFRDGLSSAQIAVPTDTSIVAIDPSDAHVFLSTYVADGVFGSFGTDGSNVPIANADISGTSDIVVVAGRALGESSTVQALGTISWREFL